MASLPFCFPPEDETELPDEHENDKTTHDQQPSRDDEVAETRYSLDAPQSDHAGTHSYSLDVPVREQEREEQELFPSVKDVVAPGEQQPFLFWPPYGDPKAPSAKPSFAAMPPPARDAIAASSSAPKQVGGPTPSSHPHAPTPGELPRQSGDADVSPGRVPKAKNLGTGTGWLIRFGRRFQVSVLSDATQSMSQPLFSSMHSPCHPSPMHSHVGSAECPFPDMHKS